MNHMLASKITRLIGSTPSASASLLLENLERDGVVSEEQFIALSREQLMMQYGLDEGEVKRLKGGFEKKDFLFTGNVNKNGLKRENTVMKKGKKKKGTKAVKRKREVVEKKKEEKVRVFVPWVHEELEMMKGMMVSYPGSGTWDYWRERKEENPGFLPNRSARSMYDAWRRYKANPEKKWPKRGSEGATRVGYSKLEDERIVMVVKKHFTLKGYSPGGYDYWDVYRSIHPSFLPGRSSGSVFRRYSRMLEKRKKAAAKKRPRTAPVYNNNFGLAKKGGGIPYEVEEDFIIQDAVITYPTIEGKPPTSKVFWRNFKVMNPKLFQNRKESSLVGRYKKLLRDAGGVLQPLKKRAKKESSAEVKCEETLEEIQNDGEKLVHLMEKLNMKQHELATAPIDDIESIAKVCVALRRELTELKEEKPTRDSSKKGVVNSINSNKKLFAKSLIKRIRDE